jgi:hypothetical protein
MRRRQRDADLRCSGGGQPGGAGRWSMVSNLVVIGFLVRMVKGLCVRVQLLKAGFGRLSNARFSRLLGECEGLIAGKPAPTDFCIAHKFGYTTEHCGSWLASDEA